MFPLIRYVAAFFLSLLLSPAAFADDYVVPGELCRGYFLVPVTLNEEREDSTLWFIYDTGASRTIVDPDSIARVSTTLVKPGQTARMSDARSGALKFNVFRARVQELDHIIGAFGRPIDGIMGYDTFQKFLLTLDYPAGEMRVTTDMSLPSPDNREVFSTRGPDKRPWLDVYFDGRKRRMLIDSGSGTSFGVNRLERYDTLTEPVPTRVAQRLDRVEYISSARFDGTARIGGYDLPQPILHGFPRTELIGEQVMRHFVWTFDVPNRRVRITRPEDTPISFPSDYGLGANMTVSKDGLLVGDVFPGSAAMGAGLQSGDVITSINDQPVFDRGCSQVGAAPRPVKLVYRREGVEQSVTVMPEVMVE
ncbi:PDZ domain-containing protein [Parvularcula sp. IMCC14364]|uniref:PDZ domain-containing protein n=1 Tax=Parvularcula sp. IMCC14364 TaxID=3067902 RepID=UPI00274187EA|nr:PDZ domain-containing protein [Parvularcula sp. IMCC14364]